MLAVLTVLLATAAPPPPAPLDAVAQSRLDPALRCLLGVYELPSERSVTITGDNGKLRGLSYTLSDGQFGKLTETGRGSYKAGSIMIDFAPCDVGTLRLTRGTIAEQGMHLRLVEKDTRFTSDGISLHGKLVLPVGGHANHAAVWIEGSNNNPSTDDSVWQYELARRGIAAFVYDKRGTGASGGAPTSDFNARARDTAAAVREVRRLVPRLQHVGVIGGSQGGWVAPLTATLMPLDFVIPAFAMAEGPIAQDRELVEQQLRLAGFGEPALTEARTLTAITERIVRTNADDAFAELDDFKAKHAGASWLAAIQPRSYTGLFLRFPSDQLKAAGPAMAQGLTFDFEPRPVIETIKPRQLWLLGGKDRQAPNAATQTILRQIQCRNPNITVVVFPNAAHGLVEPVTTVDGPMMSYSVGLFDVVARWIKAQQLPVVGSFVVTLGKR